MSSQVIIDLPNSGPNGAAVFGLWLESMLRAARQDGNLETEVGAISILSGGGAGAYAGRAGGSADLTIRQPVSGGGRGGGGYPSFGAIRA